LEDQDATPEAFSSSLPICNLQSNSGYLVTFAYLSDPGCRSCGEEAGLAKE